MYKKYFLCMNDNCNKKKKKYLSLNFGAPSPFDKHDKVKTLKTPDPLPISLEKIILFNATQRNLVNDLAIFQNSNIVFIT